MPSLSADRRIVGPRDDGRVRRVALLGLVVALSALTWSERRLLAAPPAADSAAAPSRQLPLPALPEAPELNARPAKAEDLERLQRLLSRITSKDDDVRETATREVLEVDATLLPAIGRRIDAIADDCDRDALKKTLREVRRKTRDEVRERMRAAGEKGKVVTPDYLRMLASHPRPDTKAWRDLISLVALSRMLGHIGSVEAGREMVRIYVRFGDLLRVDTQLQLKQLGDRAVAVYIETRRHPAEKVARWAERQLDGLGKAIPSEAIQVEDPAAIGDVLRALGRVRDPDAARIIISFANSDRSQTRFAARQAVALMGEVGNWQLRDTYENIVGKKPPRDWGWDRTARELFREFDRLRLSKVYDLFDQGRAAHQQRDFARMLKAYDELLTRSPEFEHRAEMAAGYFDYASQAPASERPTALLALLRAERIAANDKERARTKSLRLTLQAEDLLDRGIADQVLFQRALELDPENARARGGLIAPQREAQQREADVRRYGAAGVIGAIALFAIAFIALRRFRPKPAPAADGPRPAAPDSAPPPASQPPSDAAPDPADAPSASGPPDESALADSADASTGGAESTADAPAGGAPSADGSEPVPAPGSPPAPEPQADESESVPARGESSTPADGGGDSEAPASRVSESDNHGDQS